MSAPELNRPNPLDTALRYLGLGLSVIPVKARDKRPALASWKEFQERRPTEGELREWFSSHADLNLAIVTGTVSGIVVVDADSQEALSWMQAHHPSPIKSKTAKGAHFLFAHPGHEVRNNAKLRGMALDVRGDGGYIVAPGSIHPTGVLYEEQGDWEGIPELPVFQAAWLGEKIQPLVNPQEALDRRVRAYLDRIPGESEGNRDNQGYKVACKLVREFALPDDTALAFLSQWNERCSPPLAMTDLKRLIGSAAKSGRSPLGSKLDSTPWSPVQTGAAVDEGGPGSLNDLLSKTKTGQPRKTPGNLAKILRLDSAWVGHLNLNEMSREVFYKGKVCGDSFIDWIQEQIEDTWGVAWAREEVANKVLAQASTHPFHPVRDWLRGLAWDREERISRISMEILGNADPIATHYLRCTLIGAVRRVFHPGIKLDTLPVLEGIQGIGKSSFWRALVGPQWFGDSPLDLDSKDGFLVLHRRWSTEIAELDHLTSAKAAERVKAFLSSSEDLFRPPFSRTVQAFPRSCFLVGTTNREGFLVDPTGSRRFWPIHVNRIELELLEDWRDQIWAEAVDLEREGIPHWLDQSQESLRSVAAQTFEAQDPWEEHLDIAVEVLSRAGRAPQDGYSVTDLLGQIGIPTLQQNRSMEMRLALLMRRKGWTRRLAGLERRARWFPI